MFVRLRILRTSFRARVCFSGSFSSPSFPFPLIRVLPFVFRRTQKDRGTNGTKAPMRKMYVPRGVNAVEPTCQSEMCRVPDQARAQACHKHNDERRPGSFLLRPFVKKCQPLSVQHRQLQKSSNTWSPTSCNSIEFALRGALISIRLSQSLYCFTCRE